MAPCYSPQPAAIAPWAAWPACQFLSYEYTDGKFVIQSRASVGGGPAPTNGTFPLTDSDFYFAFVDFNNPMTPVEEAFAWNSSSDSYSNFAAWANPGRPVYIDDVTIANGGTAFIDAAVSGSDAAMARTMSMAPAGTAAPSKFPLTARFSSPTAFLSAIPKRHSEPVGRSHRGRPARRAGSSHRQPTGKRRCLHDDRRRAVHW